MDEIDIKLCKLLMGNSRLSYDELASRLGLSINAVHKRVRALVDLGIVRAFTAKPSLSSLGAISIWVYGRSSSKQIQDAHQILKKNDSTYWVAHSGGEFLYV
ncbi:MAG: winged helix-turn-helix transcriptional regulator [Thaumarchaeota archaeon]|nr:winged helix-turn-helix transcriptional regulator [Nitrososphaerota archaeon]